MKPIRIDFAASEHKQAEAVNWRRDAPDVLGSDSGKSIRLPPGVSVSMARSKSPHQTPNFLVSGLKNFLFTSCSPLHLCAQIANLDEEVFGIDCNRVARSWRV
jgi:hypothetical protein